MPLWLAPIISFLGKGWERFVSILVYLIIIGAILFACWATFIKPTFHPTPTSTQSGGVAYNYTIHIGMGGCARLPVIANKED